MIPYSKDKVRDALQVIDATIENCQKMQPKFAEGTSQHTLLKNRLSALIISKTLMATKGDNNHFTVMELLDALKPVESIIRKCINGQKKHDMESTYYQRFQKIIDAMTIAREMIKADIGKKDGSMR